MCVCVGGGGRGLGGMRGIKNCKFMEWWFDLSTNSLIHVAFLCITESQLIIEDHTFMRKFVLLEVRFLIFLTFWTANAVSHLVYISFSNNGNMRASVKIMAHL